MQGKFRLPQPANSVCRDIYQPDLALFGEKALAVNSYNRSSRVVSFNEAAVYTPYARTPSPRNKSSNVIWSSSLKGYHSLTGSQDGSQRVYFGPSSSAADFGNEACDADGNPLNRPQSRKSVTSQRPLSGRRGLRKGRPTSSHSDVEQLSREESFISEYL